jgi:hypothetical protein
MRKKILITPTEAAANKILIIDELTIYGSLSIIGLVTSESVAIQIPRVVNPAIGTDTDWTNFVSGSTAVVLNANNNRISMLVRGTYRIVKPASNGNAFGIGFE